ncbi:MAG: hypothetical protein AAGC99_20940 [Pseudomonadota bacterium]
MAWILVSPSEKMNTPQTLDVASYKPNRASAKSQPSESVQAFVPSRFGGGHSQNSRQQKRPATFAELLGIMVLGLIAETSDAVRVVAGSSIPARPDDHLSRPSCCQAHYDVYGISHRHKPLTLRAWSISRLSQAQSANTSW